MKLYTFPVAPNPTKVAAYVAEKGIEIEQVWVDLRKGEQRSPEHLARHPLGKLPVLELDDGSFLIESLAIIELLEELHPEPPMLGSDTIERARIRSIERFCDLNVLIAIGRIVHATNSPLGLPPLPEVAEEERKRLPRTLEILDRSLAESPFVAGERPTVADCTLWAALGFGRFGGFEIDPVFESIARWEREFGERPAIRSLPGRRG